MACCGGSNDVVLSHETKNNNRHNNISENAKTSNTSNPTANKLIVSDSSKPASSAPTNSNRLAVRKSVNENTTNATMASSTHSKKNQLRYLGINLPFLFEFVKNCGGYNKLSYKSTEEVVLEFIKPQTKWNEISFCEHEYKGTKYQNMISDQVTWFICNPRKHNFIQTIQILANTFGLDWNPETGAVIGNDDSGQSKYIYFYFDIFSQSQHLSLHKQNEVFLSKELIDDVKSIGKFLLILTSWESAEFLSRTWCMYEILMSAETNCEFKVAMSYQESSKFDKFIIDDASLLLNTLASKSIKSQLTQTHNPETFVMIENVIKKKLPAGFPELDKVVYGVINNWFKKYLQQKIKKSKNREEECATWKYALANIYYNERNYDEATPLFAAALEVHKKVLGYGHPYILSNLLSQADMYDQQGDHVEESEELYSQALDIQKNVQSKDHPDVIASMVRLADMYRQSGKYQQTTKLYLELLELRTATLGDDHADVLSTLNTLAEVYKAQNKFDETESLYLHAIEAYNHKKTSTSVNKLAIMNNLASIYKSRGKLAQAEVLFKEVLETRMKFLGPENANTLLSMHNLASLYNAQKRFAEAEELYVKCLETRRRVLGNDHSSTVTSMHSLGMFLQDHGRADEASALLAEANSKKVLLSSNSRQSITKTNSRRSISKSGSTSRRQSLKV